MEEWKIYKLKEIGEIVGGATPSTKNPSNYDGPIPWITPKDLSNSNERYIFNGERSITNDGYMSCSCKLLPKGTVLFSSRAPIGYVAIAAAPMCTNQGFKSFIPNSKVDSLFMFYLMKYRKDDIANLGSGTTFIEVSGSVMKEFEVKVPNLDTQKRIANVLSSLDDKIELNNRINHNLEEQAQALFKSWFVDFVPFKDGKFVESELGMIPEGWFTIPFSSFIYESKEKNKDASQKEFSVTNNGIFPRVEKFKKSLSKSAGNNKLVRYGDLVFGMSRDILNWGVMDENEGGVSSAYTVYRVDQETISSIYIKLFISSHLQYFKDLIRPAAREGQSIDKNLLARKAIIIPPKKTLSEFWKLYSIIIHQKETVENEITTLRKVLDTILPKMMSGELKINEIDC